MPGRFPPGPADTAPAAFGSLDWAAPALGWLPPVPAKTAPDPGYEAAIRSATSAAATSLKPSLRVPLEALHAEAAATCAAWHDRTRLAKLPFPPTPVEPQREAFASPGAAPAPSEASFVCLDFAISWDTAGPEILCALPSPAVVVGPLSVYSTGAAGPGSLSFSVAGGVRVYLADIPPAEIRRLSSSPSARILFETGGTLTGAQTVKLCHAAEP